TAPRTEPRVRGDLLRLRRRRLLGVLQDRLARARRLRDGRTERIPGRGLRLRGLYLLRLRVRPGADGHGPLRRRAHQVVLRERRPVPQAVLGVLLLRPLSPGSATSPPSRGRPSTTPTGSTASASSSRASPRR